MKIFARLGALLAALFAATPAFAHVGLGDHGGFMHGLMHPIGGADHVLAMVGVGLLAAQLGGRALWLVPIAFVSMMIVGGVAGFEGIDVPFVELGIAASVFVLGALVAFDVKLPTALAMAIVGAFAVFHGHAHGVELPEGSAPLAFAEGFVLATALLHVAGIALGLLFHRLASGPRAWAERLVGAAMAVAGVSLMTSN
jgi:urease accessory protein